MLIGHTLVDGVAQRAELLGELDSRRSRVDQQQRDILVAVTRAHQHIGGVLRPGSGRAGRVDDILYKRGRCGGLPAPQASVR